MGGTDLPPGCPSWKILVMSHGRDPTVFRVGAPHAGSRGGGSPGWIPLPSPHR